MLSHMSKRRVEVHSLLLAVHDASISVSPQVSSMHAFMHACNNTTRCAIVPLRMRTCVARSTACGGCRAICSNLGMTFLVRWVLRHALHSMNLTRLPRA